VQASADGTADVIQPQQVSPEKHWTFDNGASGAYTCDGGTVGSVRVQMGPTTLAECGPDSRSQELIQRLPTAPAFRVQPGGAELQLNMPAGGPVLHFQGVQP
jgi:hypothetical protein